MSGLSEEDVTLQEVVRRFAEDRIVPLAKDIDEKPEGIPMSIYEAVKDLGLFGLTIPADKGGSGGSIVTLAVATEELAAASVSVGSIFLGNIVSGHILLKHGTAEQQERWLGKIASGKLVTATAGTEAEAGSDAANISMTAVRDGDDYVLDGTKLFCTDADRADLLFVYARTASEPGKRHRGISLFVVEKARGRSFAPPELTGAEIPVVGYHGFSEFTLSFTGLRVPGENLVGGEMGEGRGFYQMMEGYELGRIQTAFRAIGVARAAYEAARAYALERVQFGQAIAKFQAIRFALAEIATEIEAARRLGYYAAEVADDGLPSDAVASMAKWYATEVAVRATQRCMNLFGGNGYTMDYPAQRYWRDAAVFPIVEGTQEIQREIVARSILGR